MEPRINSPFQLPRKWDNRKIAHSYDHPVFVVTHRALKGTLAAVLLTTHSSKYSSEESVCHWEDANYSSDIFNVQHTKLFSWSFILVNIFLFSYHLKAEDALPQVFHKCSSSQQAAGAFYFLANRTSDATLHACPWKGPEPSFISRKREAPPDYHFCSTKQSGQVTPQLDKHGRTSTMGTVIPKGKRLHIL